MLFIKADNIFINCYIVIIGPKDRIFNFLYHKVKKRYEMNIKKDCSQNNALNNNCFILILICLRLSNISLFYQQ